MESKLKRYCVGAKKDLEKLFPGYNENDIRYSLDGTQAIYEVTESEDRFNALEKEETLQVYTGSEILDMLHSPQSAGVWYDDYALRSPANESTGRKRKK